MFGDIGTLPGLSNSTSMPTILSEVSFQRFQQPYMKFTTVIFESTFAFDHRFLRLHVNLDSYSDPPFRYSTSSYTHAPYMQFRIGICRACDRESSQADLRLIINTVLNKYRIVHTVFEKNNNKLANTRFIRHQPSANHSSAFNDRHCKV